MRDPQQAIYAVVLAAGCASRFGATKQVAELNGVPLVQQAVATASKVCGDSVITVIGHDWQNVLRAMRSSCGFLVMNDEYETGLGRSIATAATAVQECADAILLIFADQPLVTAQHLEALVQSWSGSELEIVATAYDGIHGPPVLFPSGTFDALRDLRGDTGARALLRDGRFRLRSVDFEDAAIDIDTPEDLAALV